jgi:hypothetical protein
MISLDPGRFLNRLAPGLILIPLGRAAALIDRGTSAEEMPRERD